MEVQLGGHGYGSATQPSSSEEELVELRKGPWTVEEDTLLANYVSIHGEGRWNSLARHAGLKRTGKSCRLRWLNYLRPNVRRGNITLQEQLLILELHSRWGNRWSKIAQYLPGRTDNEIKNYWRTRVQKQAKQLKCDVNSKQFQDAMRFVWIPRLIERIQAGQPTTPRVDPNATPDASASSSETSELQPASSISEPRESQAPQAAQNGSGLWECGLDMEFGHEESNMSWAGDGDSLDNLWINEEDIWFLQQQVYG